MHNKSLKRLFVLQAQYFVGKANLAHAREDSGHSSRKRDVAMRETAERAKERKALVGGSHLELERAQIFRA